MEITTSNIDSNSINLVTDINVSRLVLNYGKTLEQEYLLNSINDNNITITKESLGLNTLNNKYFKIEVFDIIENKAGVGLYNIDIINNLEVKYYNALNLKQDLDNLNYYDNVLQSLNNKLDYLTANDFFFNYINFLEKKLNANNFLQHIGRQSTTRSSNNGCS